MIIFPAVDLRDGKCVRLYQGDFASTEVVAEDPVDTALNFKNEGAEYLHMVDLDGALNGEIKNLSVISNVINETNMPIQLGGGIRDLETIDKLVEEGISRAIIGTSALKNPKVVKEAVKKYGDKIAVGIDAKDGLVATEGWINVSKVNYIDFAKKMEDIGVSTIIFTDVSRDGTLTGPNIEKTLKLKDSVSCNIIASGGIKSMDDIIKLKSNGVYGAIIGKAIYNGNISLKDAIISAKE